MQTQGARQTGGKAAARFRATLTTAQIALSMALLVLAGWFAQSLANVARVDLGFRAESLAVFTIAPERNGYTPAQSAALFARLEEELAQIPGVTAAGAAGVALLDNSDWSGNVSVEGFEATPDTDTNVSMNIVSPEFFRTLEMPLISGTGFERAAEPTARASPSSTNGSSRSSRSATTPSASAWPSASTQDLNIEIVGVVRDAKYSEVKADAPPQVFMPRAAGPVPRRDELLPAQQLGAPRAALGRHGECSRVMTRTCR